ncbi:MAG TPA: MBL fold metallo-hydrolase [Firmicutes bacterium]|uniref:MBL fold metallo-hydrolase n=1 Tax=Capillibacterium thermochitinicola TaxID=2699427 RepID=A0A8J6LMC7_9FIRM|nr:MBL fold metallo-hydrolase [Capillibacterium thermochitinicola]MBA2133594.1 MBL fold metallo-hydrolase [Capillibacterium thermochitinicola]HHW12367.1 MBL fold metallo-hydrolase [Bacillota bacterium]
MRLQQFVLGELEVNSYLLWDEESLEAACFDPGGPPQEIWAELTQKKLKLKYILLTHGHYDHIGGVNELKANTGAIVAIHAADAEMATNPNLNLSVVFSRPIVVTPDQLLADGDVLCLGAQMLKINHTPGHTPGGICIATSGLLFSGDTLFAGSVGRTDLPGGDQATLDQSLQRLVQLPAETRVFPGHGPETTIGREKQFNPFLKQFGGE